MTIKISSASGTFIESLACWFWHSIVKCKLSGLLRERILYCREGIKFLRCQIVIIIKILVVVWVESSLKFAVSKKIYVLYS